MSDDLEAALARHDDSELERALNSHDGGIEEALARHSSLADLQGGYQGEPQSYSQADRDRIAEWGPSALAMAAGLALPATPLAAAAGSVLLGTAARGATPLLKGEGVDAALHEMNPATHPFQVAFEGGLPWVGKLLSRGSKAASLATLPDYEHALSLDAPLPKIDEVVSFPDKVASDALDNLTFPQKVKAAITGPASYLRRQASAASNVGGQQLDQWMFTKHRLGSQGQRVIDDVLGGLTDDELNAVTEALNGTRPAESVPVANAAARMREEFYNPLGRKGVESGMRTYNKATGESGPFRMISENYSPEIRDPNVTMDPQMVSPSDLLRSKFSTSQTELARTAEGDKGPLLTNARDIAQAYLEKMSRKVATSHAFGAPEAAGSMGERASQTLAAMIGEQRPLDAKLYQQALDHIYTYEKPSAQDEAISALTGKLSKLMLGRASLANIRQAANNLMRNGIGNTIEGVGRWSADPAMRDLAESSGALRTGFNNWAAETKPTVTQRLMAGIEDKLRGVANAGTVPYVEDLVSRAQAGDTSAALMRQLAELHIPYEQARQGLTADLMRNAFQASSARNQFFANEVGQNSELGASKVGKLLAMFQPYRWQQYRMFRDDIASPLYQGAKNLDASEFGLGAGRLARLGGTAAALSAPVSVAYSLTSGRGVDPKRVVGDWLESVMGPAASVPMALPYLANNDPGGAIKTLTGGTMGTPPLYSLPEQYARRPEQLPLDVLIAAEPTGYGALLRAPIGAAMNQAIRGK